MKRKWFVVISILLLMILSVVFLNPALVGAADDVLLKVVGLYSETTAGSISYRVGNEDWKVIKVGDQIPNNAEILVNVDRDWVEFCPTNNLNTVYEVTGNASGEVKKKVADLLKEKPRTVSFPKEGVDNPDYTNKVVAKQYLGRQQYITTDGSRVNIKYGDVLEVGGTVNIIAINNTLVLALPNGKETTVVGPVRFTVQKILEGEKLYKYLNVQ